jgi:predicted nucleic acid-binding protein
MTAIVCNTGPMIALAGIERLDILRGLMDERKGRRVAREVYGLDVMGTARLLTDAKEAQLVPSVGELFAPDAGRRLLDP